MTDPSAFDPARLIGRLESFPATLGAIVAGTRGDEWTWKPDPAGWAISEVLGHLLREEREDFRVRLRHTLEGIDGRWPPIDPEGDVAKHADIDADPAAMLSAFRDERADSVAWLRGLDAPDWDASYTHAEFGVFRAGDLLASWADHDALHARQLIKRVHQQIQTEAGPYSCRYAGEWTA